VRITGGTNRRLCIFAVTLIAASFILLAGASMLIKTLLTLQATHTGFDMHRVLAMDMPVIRRLAALRVSDFLQPSRRCEPQIDFCVAGN
jgi:hypothetical protein